MRIPQKTQQKRRFWKEIKAMFHRARIKRRWWFYGYCITYLILWVILLLIVGLHLVGINCLWHGLSCIISMSAVQQIVKTIGFGSILLAWIYNILDKEELGFKYSELVQGMYSNYDFFVLGHLLAVLICVWFAENHYLAGAVLALIIILVGCVIHCKVLSNLLFRSKRRKSVAIDEWARIITEEWDENPNRRLLDLFRIAEVIPTNDSDCSRQMEDCFSYAMLIFSRDFVIDQKRQRSLLLEISRTWDHLLRGRLASDRITALDGVFRYCANKASDYYIGPICAGYVLWFYNSKIDNKTVPTQVLPSVYHEILALESRLRENENQCLIHYFRAVYMTLFWLHFLCGTVELLSDIFPGIGSIERGDYDLLYSTAQCVFQEATYTRYFDAAFEQIFAPYP